MKQQIYKWILWVTPLFMGVMASAQTPYSKTYHQSYPAAKVSKLLLESKFGNATLKDNGSNTVTVDVRVEVKEQNEKAAKQILDRIQINIELSGGTLMVETSIESGGMSNGSFSIEYDINLPKNKDVMAECKYGNLYIDALTGAGMFEIAYGNISGRNLLTKGNLMLELAYGNATFDNLQDALMELKYSNLAVKEKARNLVIESKNSTVKIGEMQELTIESKYDDVKIGSLDQMVIEMGYTNVEIGKLSTTFVAETRYGNINLQQVAANFNKIVIEGEYGDIRLGMPDNANYKVDMECNYGSIVVPEYTGLKIEKDQHTTHVFGTVGTGKTTGALVTSSKYVNVTVTAP